MHVGAGGVFPRRRSGAVSNWNPGVRQAFFLLCDQFVKRPGSVWGKKLREVKAAIRSRHPEVVLVNGKKRYTDGHTHKMAIWRTATKFTEWLYRKWTKLEAQEPQPVK